VVESRNWTFRFVIKSVNRFQYTGLTYKSVFRCGIPVIVMGETGCGKTRLIKFMCDLWKPPGAEVNNMILMKVVLNILGFIIMVVIVFRLI
jgi:ABC-type transport system involved in cytochrome bd biosynthesis fused ATPase/permease subunit